MASPQSPFEHSLSVDTLISRLEGVLQVHDNQKHAEERTVAIGLARESVTAWKLSRGEPVAEPVRISYEKLLVLARSAQTPQDVEHLYRHILSWEKVPTSNSRESTLNVGVSIETLARNAAALSPEQLDRWLLDSRGGSEWLRGALATNPYLPLENAEYIYNAFMRGGHYKSIRSLLKTHPELLTSERMADLASRLDVSPELAAAGVDYLLPRDALTPQEMAIAANRMPEVEARMQALVTHPTATPQVWQAVARRGKLGVRIVLSHPFAFQDKETRTCVIDVVARLDSEHRNSTKRGSGLRNERPCLRDLVLSCRGEDINEPLLRLAQEEPSFCLAFIRSLSPERLADVDPCILAEIAATHPDGTLRQEAILFIGQLGSRDTSVSPLAGTSEPGQTSGRIPG